MLTVATIVIAPSGGYGAVAHRGGRRACYFDPLRWIAHWTATAGLRVLVQETPRGLVAVCPLGVQPAYPQ